MTYELWDGETLVDEADSLEAIAELKVEYRDAGLDVDTLRILQRDDQGARTEVVE